MVLADIGNTNVHVWTDGKTVNKKSPEKYAGTVYYISVNREKEKIFKKLNPSAVNLEKYVLFDTAYRGLGIDRIMACKSISDGVVVDAGSAVTIDVMQENRHLGGIIMPGVYAFKQAFGTISEVLQFEPDIINTFYPNNTSDALNTGSVGAIKCMIEKYSQNRKVYITGGDGEFLSRVIENSEYIEDLVFRGMLKTIKELEKK
jgi:type III pantothenate kinase